MASPFATPEPFKDAAAMSADASSLKIAKTTVLFDIEHPPSCVGQARQPHRASGPKTERACRRTPGCLNPRPESPKKGSKKAQAEPEHFLRSVEYRYCGARPHSQATKWSAPHVLLMPWPGTAAAYPGAPRRDRARRADPGGTRRAGTANAGSAHCGGPRCDSPRTTRAPRPPRSRRSSTASSLYSGGPGWARRTWLGHMSARRENRSRRPFLPGSPPPTVPRP